MVNQEGDGNIAFCFYQHYINTTNKKNDGCHRCSAVAVFWALAAACDVLWLCKKTPNDARPAESVSPR